MKARVSRSKLGSVDYRSTADTAGQLLPGCLRIFGEAQQPEIRLGDHPGVKERVEIDDLRPIAAVDANQGNQAALARLHQREDLEQLGERAEASGKRHHARRA